MRRKIKMYLDRIIENKKIEIKKNRKAYEKLAGRTGKKKNTRDFLKALSKPGLNVIGEVKRFSPTNPLPLRKFDPGAIARKYEQGGVSAVSVITDRKFFGGSFEILKEVSENIGIPVLCKEFVIDEIQIRMARASGADAVLLIARILDEEKLRSFLLSARSLDMRALVEIHDEDDLIKAVGCGAKIIGINNRDLDTLKTDLGVTVRLAGLVPDDKIIVSESGIKTYKDILRVRGAEVDAVLIGAGLLTRSEIADRIHEFRGI